MLRHCRSRRSSSDGRFTTAFLRSRFFYVTPQNTHNCYSTMLASSSSNSPWYQLIRAAIAQHDLVFGESVHADVIKHGYTTSDRFLMNNLINMYSKCGSLKSARQLFDVMPHRDPVTWNSILVGYAFCCSSHTGYIEEGVHLFKVLLRSSTVSLTKLTFAPVLKLCSMTGYVWSSECVQGFATKIGLESEMLISGVLVNIYIKFGKVSEARIMFDHMKETDRDMVLWKIMLRAYVKMGLQDAAFDLLSDFHRSEVVTPDIDSLQSVLRGFAKDDDDTYKKQNEQVQAYALKLSLFDDKFGKVKSWNKTMSHCYQFGDHWTAIKCLLDMNQSNVKLDNMTFVMSLATVAQIGDLKLGEQIHGMTMKSGFKINISVSNSLISMYSKVGCLTSVKRVFFDMETTDVVSWNSVINSYVHSGLVQESLCCFVNMLHGDIRPDHFTFASILRACSSFSTGPPLSEQIHVHAIKSGLESDTFISTSLIFSYSRHGRIEQAELLFINKNEFDLGLWNAMMFGYINSGNSHKSWEHFTMMHKNGEKPDEITLATMAKACAFLASSKLGRQVHGYAFKHGVDQDLYLSSSLLDMYIKFGDMEDAHQVFDEIPSPDEVSWTSMISGCVENGDENRALVIYHKMRRSGIFPDEYTFATLTKACSYSTALEQGRQIHANAIKCNCGLDTYVSTSLIDFYAKCGNIEESFRVFKKTHIPNIVLSNAMLLGLAQYGTGKEALDLFNDLISNSNLLPDRVTFIGVLSACSHSGLISEAHTYLKSMKNDYGIEPGFEHYTYLVDALGRAGRVLEAEKLIASMRLEVSGPMYRIMLGACRFQENMEAGKRVATKVLKLQPFESSTYVLLSSVYACFMQWSEVADAWKTMKSKNLKKDPGFSWIYVKNKAHVFFVDDISHSQHEKVKDLIKLIKEDGSISDTNSVLFEA